MTNDRRRAARIPLLVASFLALCSSQALAHHPVKATGHIGPWLKALTQAPSVISGTWKPLVNAFPGPEPGTALLLTDGTVMMHSNCTRKWFRLTPNAKGSYINGTWTALALLPAGYSPLYFASQVLPDGRVIMNGGEYNGAGCPEGFTTMGALYDPVKNTWTSVPPPPGWTGIGDAQSSILPNGNYMLANPLTKEMSIATIIGTAVTWTPTGTGKADFNDEEGWSLLPNGTVLTVDAWRNSGQTFSNTETYSPVTGAWSNGKKTVGSLFDPISKETGPAVLLPNGKLLHTGANSCGLATCPGHTGIFHTATGNWTAGPDFPQIAGDFYDVSDGPASLLPNGHVLIQASPNFASNFNSPSHFFEFDGASLVRVNEPGGAPASASFEGRMLLLPTGQVLWGTDQGNVEVYTPKGTPDASSTPTITGVASDITRGTKNNSITGTLFNGRSEGATYGDDAQMSTNYPLVRITNIASGNVCFARTHGHSSMGVASTAPASTLFDVPSTTPPVGIRACDAGASNLQVVVNGIASVPHAVTVH